MRPIAIHGLGGIGEVEPEDDLAAFLADALARLGLAPAPDDVLVVTSKIVSKAENRFVRLEDVTPGPTAKELAAKTHKDPRLVELVLAESSHVLRAIPHVLITRHRLGLVMANAGIDQSNLGPDADDRVLLLPENPDRSAAAIRERLRALLGKAPAVVLSDSFGRAWRMGVVNVAIGAAGLPALIDLRGAADREGRTLEVTQIALGDIAAAAAGLVMGEADEGVPAALVQGYAWQAPDAPAAALLRPPDQDLFL